MTDAHSLKERAALASIAASALITLGKLVAGLLSGSLALLSESGHALLDTGATILTYYAVRVAHRPADEQHHYGHGKAEALAALVETGLLFALSTYVLVEAIRRLFEHAEIEVNALAYGVLIASIAIDLVRWRSLSRIAKETKSDALAADALHFSSDLLASVMVLLGLTATHFGITQGDALAAFGVAIFVAIAGYRLGKATIATLLDAAPQGMADKIRALVARVPGVVAVDTVRLRPVGPEIMGDLGVSVPRTMALERVAALKDDVAAAIKAECPDVSVTITTAPKALDDETILERVLLIAARSRQVVHNITVQQVEDRISISLDLEIDGRMPHGQAHEIASHLETEIADEIGADVEIETHIEPLELRELSGHDTHPSVRDAITEALRARAAEWNVVKDIHDVRVRETAAGLVVNYHCRVDPALSVSDVHEFVDRLDRKLKRDFSWISRIVGHAEILGEAERMDA
jgi:cation diffusion facilitator family transporter